MALLQIPRFAWRSALCCKSASVEAGGVALMFASSRPGGLADALALDGDVERELPLEGVNSAVREHTLAVWLL